MGELTDVDLDRIEQVYVVADEYPPATGDVAALVAEVRRLRDELDGGDLARLAASVRDLRYRVDVISESICRSEDGGPAGKGHCSVCGFWCFGRFDADQEAEGVDLP